MSQISSLLCAATLFSLLLCVLFLLLPLQYPKKSAAPIQVTQKEQLFSYQRHELDRICISQGGDSFCLLNLGDRFIMEGYEMLSLDPLTLQNLLTLLENFPLSSYIVENQTEPADLQIEIYGTRDKQTLLIKHSENGLILFDGTQTYRYPEKQLEALLVCAEELISPVIVSWETMTQGTLRLSGGPLQETFNLSYIKENEMLHTFCEGQEISSSFSEKALSALCSLQAQEIAVLSPDSEDLDFFGLSDPFWIMELHFQNTETILSFSKPQSDGKIYLYREEIPVLYAANLLDFPFLSLSETILLEESLFSANYPDTTIVQVRTPDHSYSFSKWNGQVLCGRKEIPETEFYDFYRLCVNLIPQELLLLPSSEEKLLLTLQFSYTNPHKPKDTLSFYSYNDTFCSLSINGSKQFLLSRNLPKEILSALEKLL